MLESSFAVQVEHLLDLFGWRWCHYQPAIRQSGTWATPLKGSRGLPDYTATRDGRLVFAEIKGDNGRLSRDQKDWLDLLINTAAEVYVWYPHDLERVKELLR
jgi:hypothetical protein